MSFIGNLLWFILGGFVSGITWLISGIFWCITIIGIPVGLQCFKFAGLAFFPFGKKVTYPSTGAASTILNILWIIFSGIWLAVGFALIGIIFCITIIGIPFGKQYFKFAQLALSPFGAVIE